jgi:hypothetical protein
MQVEDLDPRETTNSSPRDPSLAPPCCGSGCAVCVLDYWIDDEHCLQSKEEISNIQSMLEAFEKAQEEAQQIIEQPN